MVPAPNSSNKQSGSKAEDAKKKVDQKRIAWEAFKKVFNGYRKGVLAALLGVAIFSAILLAGAIIIWPIETSPYGNALAVSILSAILSASLVAIAFELYRVDRNYRKQNYIEAGETIVDLFRADADALSFLNDSRLDYLRKQATTAKLKANIADERMYAGLLDTCFAEVDGRMRSLCAKKVKIERVCKKIDDTTWKVEMTSNSRIHNFTDQTKALPLKLKISSGCIPDSSGDILDTEDTNTFTIDKISVEHYDSNNNRNHEHDVHDGNIKIPRISRGISVSHPLREWIWRFSGEGNGEIKPGESCDFEIGQSLLIPAGEAMTQWSPIPREEITFEVRFVDISDKPIDPGSLVELAIVGCSICPGARKRCTAAICKDKSKLIKFDEDKNQHKYTVKLSGWVGSDITIELKW